MTVRTCRKIHRYLGLVIGLQLTLWTAGGLFFSLNPIAKVRGETEAAEPQPLDRGLQLASPESALNELRRRQPQSEIRSVVLRPHLGGAVYEIAYSDDGEESWALANASTGELRAAVTRDEALEIARRAYSPSSSVAETSLITEAGPGSEYRERPLPAYRVTFSDPLGTRLYVSVDRGVVTARRNHRWRWFDLMWMLHIMDYAERDNFNTLLLQTVSTLGLVTIVSGFVLAGVTSPRLRRLSGRSEPTVRE